MEYVNDSHSLNIAEPRALDLQPVIAFQGFIPDLGPDMLSLSITIGPDEQSLGTSGLIFDVRSNFTLILN